MASGVRIDPAHVRIEQMASGHLTLVLREQACWEDFEGFANDFLSTVGGTAQSRVDSPVDRVWTVRIGGAEVWLAFDDPGACFEINAKDAAGDACVRTLAAQFGLPAK
jgi:hypothetical protein